MKYSIFARLFLWHVENLTKVLYQLKKILPKLDFGGIWKKGRVSAQAVWN